MLVLVLVIVAASWLVPKPYTHVTTVDGQHAWNRGETPEIRDFIWEPAVALEGANEKQTKKVQRKDDSPSEPRPSAIR